MRYEDGLQMCSELRAHKLTPLLNLWKSTMRMSQKGAVTIEITGFQLCNSSSSPHLSEEAEGGMSTVASREPRTIDTTSSSTSVLIGWWCAQYTCAGEGESRIRD